MSPDLEFLGKVSLGVGGSVAVQVSLVTLTSV